MPDDPSVYGKFMNFFLPPSAQVGGPALAPPTGLYDMLGSFGKPPTPEEEMERKKQQERQKQMMAMSQYGLKMMEPQQPQTPPPQPQPVAPQQPPQPMPQPQQQVEPAPPPRAPIPAYAGSYDPRDPRRRNPIAGMPTPFGGLYR